MNKIDEYPIYVKKIIYDLIDNKYDGFLYGYHYNKDYIIKDLIYNKNEDPFYILNCDSYKEKLNKKLRNKLNLNYNNLKIILCGLGNNYTEIFYKALQVNNNLKILQFTTTLNTSYKMTINLNQLYNSLLNNKELLYLDLCHNFLNDINLLPKILENKPSLNYLDLSNNCITDINPLNQILKNNLLLSYLDLSHNYIYDLNIFYNLLKNNNLNYLNLSHNKIKNINSLINLLSYNKLKYLDLTYNEIVDLKLLLKALENNTTLKCLYLSDISIDDVKLINEILEKNKTINFKLYGWGLWECLCHNIQNEELLNRIKCDDPSKWNYEN